MLDGERGYQKHNCQSQKSATVLGESEVKGCGPMISRALHKTDLYRKIAKKQSVPKKVDIKAHKIFATKHKEDPVKIQKKV